MLGWIQIHQSFHWLIFLYLWHILYSYGYSPYDSSKIFLCIEIKKSIVFSVHFLSILDFIEGGWRIIFIFFSFLNLRTRSDLGRKKTEYCPGSWVREDGSTVHGWDWLGAKPNCHRGGILWLFQLECLCHLSGQPFHIHIEHLCSLEVGREVPISKQFICCHAFLLFHQVSIELKRKLFIFLSIL